MTDSFYDDLAPFYKYLFKDWDRSVEEQAAMLEIVINEYFNDTEYILDAACGIGTQSIGLASRGFTLTASDFSSRAVQRAQKEARKRKLNIKFNIADMRTLWQTHQQEFDLVIACDNAIPHLLNDDDILLAFTQFYRCTRVGGGCLFSVRDYSEIDCRGRRFLPRHVHDIENGKVIVFDVWEFSDSRYELTIYIIEDKHEGAPITHIIRGGSYYCVELPRLEKLLSRAGFEGIITLRDRFFQPLVVGRKK